MKRKSIFTGFGNNILAQAYRTFLTSILLLPGARLAVIEIMLREASEAVRQKLTLEGVKVLAQLIAIKNEQDVPIEWDLKTVEGGLYTGAIRVSNEPDFLEI